MRDPARRDPRGQRWNGGHRRELERMIEGAAWAPFHRRADGATHRHGELDSPLPWRFHVLEDDACLALVDWIGRRADAEPDSEWSRARQSRIPGMLAACGALVQATWLPDPAPGVPGGDGADDRGAGPVMTLGNVEHVAAASAAVQNLLLAAEARGWKSYWSSGGILRDPELFARLGIGSGEALLGSLFLSPVVPEGAVEKPGGLRDERGEPGSWVRWVEPLEPA